jgi:hypothetical protein
MHSISIACDGQLGRDDETAKANLIKKLFALAKVGFISDPFGQTMVSGSTGKTHYQMILVSEEGNTHRPDEIPDVCYSTRCF